MSIAKLYDAALATSSGLCLKSGCAGGKSDALALMEPKFGASSQGAERPPKRFARDSKTKDLAGAGIADNTIDVMQTTFLDAALQTRHHNFTLSQ